MLELVLQCPRKNKQSIYAETWGYSSRKEDYRAQVHGMSNCTGRSRNAKGTPVSQSAGDFAEKPPNNLRCVQSPLSLLAQLGCMKLSHVGMLFQSEVLEGFSMRQCWNIPFDNFFQKVSGFQFEIILVKWFILHLQDETAQQGQAWFKINYLDPLNFFRMFIYAQFEN